ncbi:hypothetical protein [Winogradskyella marincola]|uniref:Uncharacterized protein n=1 Tax=Winogradskyella marincola TaxID=3037795 RepID=A0ABT6FX20_9FLAO|nr:hypothetical protein [Winogradskyella sp. YYF002]MDG4714341.1 hypothetical protein [Winogradskyella sp. YYF002]
MSILASIIAQPKKHLREWDFLIFTVLTALSVGYGQTTVFYVIYFFWWSEFIRIIIKSIFQRFNKNNNSNQLEAKLMFGSLFMMLIYLVFIIVFFGLIANWNNSEITLTNMKIMFFRNWFFNINLLFVLLEHIYINLNSNNTIAVFGQFTSNMLVLHISIILGGIIMFFIVKPFPETFSPDNLWCSVLIILPFLLLKMGMQFILSPKKINAR